MRRHGLITQLSKGFILLVVAGAFISFGFAQSQPSQGAPSAPQQSYQIRQTQINSGMAAEWEDFFKNDLIPLLKKAGTKQMSTWTTDRFGPAGTYFSTSPLQSLAELDTPNPLLKELAPTEIVVLISKMQRFVASSRTYVLAARPDLGIAPAQGYALKMGVLATFEIAPGRTDDFEKKIKAVVAIIGKTNAKGVLTGKVGLGGNPNEYSMLVLFDSFADLEKFGPAFSKAMGEAKLAPQTGIVMHTEYIVIHNIPELSIQPAAR
jgi:hypothetical protein